MVLVVVLDIEFDIFLIVLIVELIDNLKKKCFKNNCTHWIDCNNLCKNGFINCFKNKYKINVKFSE